MPEMIAFTRNHNDLSNESGFQFEFNCDRCSDGYRSSFVASKTAAASSVADVASGMFGGLFGGVADATRRVREATMGPERDAAFKSAIREVQPNFHRCSRCAKYVCDGCWNAEAELCMECAPSLAGEMESARARIGAEQMEEALRGQKVFSGDTSKRRTVCPECGQPAGTGKFCGSCGAPLGPAACPQCGAQNSPGQRFCGECGTKIQ